MVFVHGFGCDQNMWRLLAPHFAERYTVILLDLVGSGNSDLSAYHPRKYATLHGYADDILEVLAEVGREPAIFVGHSVSAMIGMLADLKSPGQFAAHIMVGPSPCYINDRDYFGGFTQDDIVEICRELGLRDVVLVGHSVSAMIGVLACQQAPELFGALVMVGPSPR